MKQWFARIAYLVLPGLFVLAIVAWFVMPGPAPVLGVRERVILSKLQGAKAFRIQIINDFWELAQRDEAPIANSTNVASLAAS
jgi:hypothetical protein